MTGYWLGMTVGLFLGAYIGVLAMTLFFIAKRADKRMKQQGVNKSQTTK